MAYDLNQLTYVPLTEGVHPVTLKSCTFETDTNKDQYLLVTFVPTSQPDFINTVAIYDREKFKAIESFIKHAQTQIQMPGLPLGELFNQLIDHPAWILISKNPGVNKDGKDVVYTNRSIYFQEPQAPAPSTATVVKKGKRA